MADIKTKEARSFNMSRIRGTNTQPEVKVRQYLFSKGFRYRKNDKRLPGTPDIVLPKYHTVVFVNGCYWHRHANCKYATTPSSNAEFWITKFSKNVENDKKNRIALTSMGWAVLTVWECEIKKDFDATMIRLESQILSNLE